MSRRAALLITAIAALAACVAAVLHESSGTEHAPHLDRGGPDALPGDLGGNGGARVEAEERLAELKGGGAEPPDMIAWRLLGEVVNAVGDEPVPFPQVQAWWVEGPRTQLLAQGRGDALGAFEMALPALEGMSGVRRLSGVVEVRATAAGFGPQAAVKARDVLQAVRLPVKERDLRCTVRLAAGRTLSGRLVTHDMAWPRLARVRVVPEDKGRAWKTLSQTCVGPDARFTVLVPTDEPIVLEIHAPGFGRLRYGPYGPNVADAGDILLVTATTIQGHVVDEAGRPRAGAWISARRPVDSPPPVGWSRISSGSGRWSEERVRVQADAGGRFVIPSGRAGTTWTLEVVSHTPRRGIANMILDDVMLARLAIDAPKVLPAMESVQAQSGDRDVRLVSLGTTLRIRVTDIDGAALPGTEVVLLGWGGEPQGTSPPPGGPPAERLIVETDDDGCAWARVRTPSTWYVEAEAAQQATRRTTPDAVPVRSTARGAGPVRAEAWISVPDGGADVEQGLVMPLSTGEATLDVHVASESGSSLPPVKLQVFTRAGRRLFIGDIPQDASLQLPAGACRVHISSGPGVHPTAPFSALALLPPGAIPRAFYDAHVEDLDLTAGRTTTLDVTLPVLAELRIEVVPSAPTADRGSLASLEVGVAYAGEAGEPRLVPLPTREGTLIAHVRPGRARVHIRRTREGDSPRAARSKTDVHEVVFASGETCRLEVTDE
ncbi:MAG: hypothetical protein R3F05_16955 [Planctomycetota bacterium]